MTVCLPSDLEREIRTHCERAYPREACGLLIGRHDVTGQYVVTEIVPSPNLATTPEVSFEIDPSLIIQYQKKSRTGGGEIIGHYHSHPDGEAALSVRDQEQNYSPELIWLIVAVHNGRLKVMKAYDMSKGGMSNVPFCRKSD